MEGMSERQYAAHTGLSRSAIQKAKATGRLVLLPGGSIDAHASDARRAETTDPSKTRKAPAPRLKPVPETAVAAVGDTLREHARQAQTLKTLATSLRLTPQTRLRAETAGRRANNYRSGPRPWGMK